MSSGVTNNSNNRGVPSSTSSSPSPSSATSAARVALERLNQRREKINNLQERTSNTASLAAEFAENARRLAGTRGKQPAVPVSPPVPTAEGSSRPSPARQVQQPSSNLPVPLPSQNQMDEMMNFSDSFRKVGADPKILESFRKQMQNKSVEDLNEVLAVFERSSAKSGRIEEFEGEKKIIRELIAQKSSVVSTALSYLNPYAYMK